MEYSRSFHDQTNPYIAMDTIPGTAIGNTILDIILKFPAPSIFALSMRESGIPSKYPLSVHVPTGRVKTT